MKQMMFAFVALSLLSSCTQVAGWFGTNSDSTNLNHTDSLSGKMYRDESITQANAYSDLFLDSNAVETYIQKEKLDDSTSARLRNFYALRNNQFAWFATNGPTEQARGLWSLYANEKDSASKTVDKTLKDKMDTLLQQDSVSIAPTDSSYAQTELSLTRNLIQYAAAHPTANINTNTFYYLVPAKKLDAMDLADSILNRQKDSAVYASNRQYSMMKQQLSIYYNIAKNGGWQPLNNMGKMQKGSKSPSVVALKKRLSLTKDYTATDTSDVYTDSLQAAIKDLQQRNGLKPDGVVSDSLINALNVPVDKRIQQILVNMNRMMWMQPLTDSNRVQVNIPSFMLYAYEGNQQKMQMPVIVGKEGTGTVMFHGAINQVIFNPVWNVPSGIVRDEIKPAMKSDPSYLKKHHMEIVSQGDSLPVIRQLPGKDNALGRIKFLFPNSYDIYLHDTPDKTAFAHKDRALSHGCIRVYDAPALAQYLLRGQPDWSAEKIKSALNSNKEQTVNLSTEEPVYISYYTAWADENGKMNFRNDVYGHDEDAMQKMFKAKL